MLDRIYYNEAEYKSALLAKYTKEGATRCPNPGCGSDDLQTTGNDTDASYHTRDIECLNCGATWQDVYVMAAAKNLELPNG